MEKTFTETEVRAKISAALEDAWDGLREVMGLTDADRDELQKRLAAGQIGVTESIILKKNVELLEAFAQVFPLAAGSLHLEFFGTDEERAEDKAERAKARAGLRDDTEKRIGEYKHLEKTVA